MALAGIFSLFTGYFGNPGRANTPDNAGPSSPHPIIIESSSQPVTLLELFTSEGCSSCPPAETFVGRFTKDPLLWKRIVPVVFHVDYWDYLGWPDAFAKRAYTQRQYDYAARFSSSSVYTPEFIVQGQEWRVRSNDFPESTTPPVGSLRIMTDGPVDVVKVTYNPDGKAGNSGLIVNVAWLGLGITSNVKRGENAGSQLQHDFTALDYQWRALGSAASVLLGPPQLPTVDQPRALAVWVSDREGHILVAAGGLLQHTTDKAVVTNP